MGEVFAAADGGGGGAVEGLGFVVVLAADDHRPEDARQFVPPATIPSALPSRPLPCRTESPIGPLARLRELAAAAGGRVAVG